MRKRGSAAFFSWASIVVILILFAAAGVFARSVVTRNLERQHQLREAQSYRARLLRLQIDEETGIRGYAATGHRVFLQPYVRAQRAFEPTADALSGTLRALNVDSKVVREDIDLNHRWQRSFATPMLAVASPRNQLTLQFSGKELVDGFRTLDASLNETLTREAEEADLATARSIEQILLSFFLGGAAIAAVLGAFAVIQARTTSQLEIQRRAYEEEKRVADLLQEAFASKALPRLPATDLHAIYSPAGFEAKVGGDWYDAFELSDNRILFSIGDVAGHGIDAAVTMSRVRQAILAIGIRERDPASILTHVNEILLLQNTAMVTAVCGFIDFADRSITYSTAGHPPMVVAGPDGAVKRLPYWGPPLGAADEIDYRTFTAAAEPGATLFLYTDGLVEQRRDMVAGEARLLKAIEALSRRESSDPAAALMEAMLDGEAPRDDVAILTIRFHAPAAPGGVLSSDLGVAAARPVHEEPDILQRMLPELYVRRILASEPLNKMEKRP